MDRNKQQILLKVANDSIDYGLRIGSALAVDINHYHGELRHLRASFVTLKIDGKLRGCIGSLEAHRPLVVDIAENAFSAAFRDPRFTPLSIDEFDELEIQISVLTPPEPVEFTSENDLIDRLRPGVDGLILHEGNHRGTFLPAVWQQLPRPGDFLDQLKRKSGLPVDYWSDSIVIERYTTESFC